MCNHKFIPLFVFTDCTIHECRPVSERLLMLKCTKCHMKKQVISRKVITLEETESKDFTNAFERSKQ